MKHTSFEKPALQPASTHNRQPLQRLGLLAVLAAVLCATVWGLYFITNPVLSATGYIQHAEKPTNIQVFDAAVIEKIYVMNGDDVAKDQILAKLASPKLLREKDLIETELASVSRQITTHLAMLKKTTAETQHISKNYKEAIVQNVVQKRIHNNTEFQENLSRIRHVQAGLHAQAKSLSEQLELIEQELRSQEQLRNRGLATKARTLALKRERSRVSGLKSDLKAQWLASEAEASMIAESHKYMELSEKIELRHSLNALEARQDSLITQKKHLQNSIKMLTLRAPFSGTVLGLTQKPEGSVIGAGENIASVLPSNTSRKIITEVSPQIAQSLSVGQRVRIQTVGSARAIHSSLEGQIERISLRRLSFTEELGPSYEIVVRPMETNPNTPSLRLEEFRTALPVVLHFADEKSPSGWHFISGAKLKSH